MRVSEQKPFAEVEQVLIGTITEVWNLDQIRKDVVAGITQKRNRIEEDRRSPCNEDGDVGQCSQNTRFGIDPEEKSECRDEEFHHHSCGSDEHASPRLLEGGCRRSIDI